jgi:glycosyltransferase involved in cell wall biosynthesis
MPPTISVIVMAYNEVESVVKVTRDLHAVLSALTVPFELLLVDDGSSDGTSQAVESLAAELPSVRTIHHSENRGLGGVYRTGFSGARGEFITFFPADGQFEAGLVSEFFSLITSHDLVLGTLPKRQGSLGKILSLTERRLYRALIGSMPEFQGIFMIRKAVLDVVPLLSDGRGWGIVMELILRVFRANRYRIVNHATRLLPRRFGHSKANTWRNIVANMRQLLTLRRLLATPVNQEQGLRR